MPPCGTGGSHDLLGSKSQLRPGIQRGFASGAGSHGLTPAGWDAALRSLQGDTVAGGRGALQGQVLKKAGLFLEYVLKCIFLDHITSFNSFIPFVHVK